MAAAAQTENRPQRTIDILRNIGAPTLAPDLDAARQYLRALTGSADTPMMWIAIAESQAATKARPGPASLMVYGTLDEHAAALAQKNKDGCKVSCVVNRTNGSGWTSSDIEAVRALWIRTDSDSAAFSIEQVHEVRPKPHLIVEASKGEYDLYWVMREGECSLREFAEIVRKLALHFQSSRGVLHIEQTFRVPGFWSWRDESKVFQSEITIDRTRGLA